MNKGTSRLLLALSGGIGIGLAVHRIGTGSGSARVVLSVLEPLGSLWLKALKMTLVPLIFSLVVGALHALLSRNAGGRVLTASLSVFGVLLVVSAFAGVALSIALLALWPVPQGVLSALLPTGATPPPPTPGLMAGLLELMPDTPVAAAAAGQMAPLAIFAIGFGWALSRLPSGQATALRRRSPTGRPMPHVPSAPRARGKQAATPVSTAAGRRRRCERWPRRGGCDRAVQQQPVSGVGWRNVLSIDTGLEDAAEPSCPRR